MAHHLHGQDRRNPVEVDEVDRPSEQALDVGLRLDQLDRIGGLAEQGSEVDVRIRARETRGLGAENEERLESETTVQVLAYRP